MSAREFYLWIRKTNVQTALMCRASRRYAVEKGWAANAVECERARMRCVALARRAKERIKGART